MVEEVLVEYLSEKDRKLFESCHPLTEDIYAANRELKGWYVNGNIRAVMYYVPSWWSRIKMYVLGGWKWEPKEKE